MGKSSSKNPQLSVIVVARCRSRMLQYVLKRLDAQTVASNLECLLVVRDKKEFANVDVLVSRLGWGRILELGSLESEGAAKAAGVTAARAPLVAFLEDHSFPDVTWAQVLIDAHDKQPLAAVAPAIENANPRTAVSWGCFLVYYGFAFGPKSAQAPMQFPANHSCYRRDVLLAYGEKLPQMLEAEHVLHQDLQCHGHDLLREPGAVARHLNYSRLATAMTEYFIASRVFAASRACEWHWSRRFVYTCGSPLLPLIRIRRLVKAARKSGVEAGILRDCFTSALLTLTAGAAGEMLGYAKGFGNSKTDLMNFEINRELAFPADELDELFGPSMTSGVPETQH